MVASAGSGPDPIHHKALNAERLSKAIQFCLSEPAQIIAARIAVQMKKEDGVDVAVRSFHANLPLEQMRCEILPDQPAVWSTRVGRNHVRLSRLAAAILTDDAGLKQKKLKL
jgi:hypothetical protein